MKPNIIGWVAPRGNRCEEEKREIEERETGAGGELEQVPPYST
jgi:hypothetical protein